MTACSRNSSSNARRWRAAEQRVLVGREVDLLERLRQRYESGGDAGGQRIDQALRDVIQGAPHGASHAARRDPARERVHGDQPSRVQQVLDLALDHLEQRIRHAALRVHLPAHHHRGTHGERAGQPRLAEEVAGEGAGLVGDPDGDVAAAGARVTRRRAPHPAEHGEHLA